MTEPSMTEPPSPVRPFPNLDPRYKPATEDSGLIVRWIGTTARIAELRYLGIVDPFQLLSFAAYIKKKALDMISVAEHMEAAKAEEAAASAAAARAQIAIPRPGMVLDGSLGRGFEDQSLRRER